ncbi:MAG: hypothetical protein AB7L13_04855 [Acidimicrobiia bacterium]
MTALRRPVFLLGSQGFALGLLCGLLIIPTAGIFLSAYGARALAWVYLAVAAVGFVLTPTMTRVLRRWSIATVSVPILLATAIIVAAAWAALELWDARWVSFVLEVMFPMLLQLGFLIVGGTAGRLLTVREMKEKFPRVVAAFVVGFLVSGIAAPPLLAVVGETPRLLAGTCVASVVLLLLVFETRRRFPDELSAASTPVSDDEADTVRETVPLRRTFSHRLVLLLLAYQLASQLGTQLIDFLVYDRATARYSSSEDLVRFTSVFTIVLNVVDIIFLAFVAGRLLRRFGMRVGLVANPISVLLFVSVAAVSSIGAGIGSLAVFYAIGAARVSDLSFTDGATRGSMNAAYQALPVDERLPAQAAVEGLGQPGAIGLAGVVLLVVEHGFHGGASVVIGIAIVVCAAWTLIGAQTYRSYRTTLHENLRSRRLPPRTEGDARPFAPAQLAALELGLAAIEPDTRELTRVLRSVPRAPDPALADLLAGHGDHPDREIGLAVLKAFARAAAPDDTRRHAVMARVIENEAERSLAVLRAMNLTSGRPPLGHLHEALADERLLTRDRALAALALTGDPAAIARADGWLRHGDERAVAMAIETIEVTAPGALRHRCVALLQTGLDVSAQLHLHRSITPVHRPAESVEALLSDLIVDPHRMWNRPWLRTCALYGAVAVEHPALGMLAADVRVAPDDIALAEVVALAR